MICLEIAQSSHPVKYVETIGNRSPLYAGASYKVIMAYLPRSVQEAILVKGLQAYTEHTIVDTDKLLKNLEKVKEEGWCYSVGE